jgi:hypothetical protein
MDYFTAMDSPKHYPGLPSDSSIRAMAVLEIAFDGFFADTKQLVKEGVERDINFRLSNAISSDARNEIVSCSESRKAALKKWLSSSSPLDYGDDGPSSTFLNLSQAIAHSEKESSSGLPHLSDNPLAPSSLVTLLIAMSRPDAPSYPSAPVLSRGAFLPLLKLAHRHITSLANSSNKKAQDDFLSDIFLRAIDLFKVRFVPYHKPLSLSHTRGRPAKSPLFDSWAQLSEWDSRKHVLLASRLHPPPSPPLHSASAALHSAIAVDSNVPWSTEKLTLSTLHTILNKSNLPSNYTLPSSTPHAYVDETYSWVKHAYNSSNRLHHLALITGIITSLLLPNLFVPTDTRPFKSLFQDAHTPDQVHRLYNTIPWVSRQRNGMVSKPVFVSMVTTFIIALYEHDSPLRLSMKSSKKHGLGDKWTSKHCSFPLLLFLSSFLILPFSSFQRCLLSSPYSPWSPLGKRPWCSRKRFL